MILNYYYYIRDCKLCVSGVGVCAINLTCTIDQDDVEDDYGEQVQFFVKMNTGKLSKNNNNNRHLAITISVFFFIGSFTPFSTPCTAWLALE